jgi:hypothetical protein
VDQPDELTEVLTGGRPDAVGLDVDHSDRVAVVGDAPFVAAGGMRLQEDLPVACDEGVEVLVGEGPAQVHAVAAHGDAVMPADGPDELLVLDQQADVLEQPLPHIPAGLHGLRGPVDAIPRVPEVQSSSSSPARYHAALHA